MDHKSYYIPRPSLSSNSSNTNKNHDSIRCYHRDSEVIDIERKKDEKDPAKKQHAVTTSSTSSHSSQHSDHPDQIETCVDGDPAKRGSRSSQGSSDSEHSIHSASSLLLTVANLENFAKIQENSRHHNHLTTDSIAKIHSKPSSIINIHPSNLLSSSHAKPTKELDQLSMASSTHFTMVNGFGRAYKKKSSYICKRSRQVSVLIVTMSVLFLVGISTAVYLLEMRNREMPR